MKKLYIVIRDDIKIPPGKAISQAVHSVTNIAVLDHVPVIILKSDKETLEKLIKKYNGNSVTDAGRTVFPEPTLTCASFVIDENNKDFEDLKLY